MHHSQVEARLPRQTLRTLRQVVAPKMGAVQRCLDAAPADPLSFSVLFSSVSAIAGIGGQANYCAANAALDAFAAQQAAAGSSTVAVQWGAWHSVGESMQQGGEVAQRYVVPTDSPALPLPGMVHKTYTLSKRQAATMGMLSSEAGLAALNAVLVARRTQGAAVVGAAGQVFWRNLLATVQPVPPLFAALEVRSAAAALEETVQAAPGGPLPGPAAAKGPELSPAAIEEAVRQLAGAVLGVEAVDADQPLAEQGLDSLAGLELRQKLQVGSCVPAVLWSHKPPALM